MNMDGVYEELDDAKLEIERLGSDYRKKVEQYGNLKKMYNEQVDRLRRASEKVDSQSQELSEMMGQLTVVKNLSEELKCKLNEKELSIKRLSAANDALRSGGQVKLQELEEEKRALIISLDEADLKSTSQEQKLRALTEEIVGLKGLLESSRKRCSEAEEKAKAPKEVRERDDIIGSLEEEVRKLEDQLKWKKEQFQHLEEAHEKLRREYRKSEKEWEKEKSAFLDEICSLQTSLESQTRISEDLGNRLQRCNQALAHEESVRRTLEFQVNDYKARLEDIFIECGNAKSQVESLTSERDNETANLRYTLGKKESILKEMEYQAKKLELENQDLLKSLKQLQEENISHVGNSSSLLKLKNRLKSVEQMHRDCSANYRAKEAAWTTELEKLTSELVECRSELIDKEDALDEVKKELESCHASLMHLMLLNEEITVMLLVMKSGISEAQIKLADDVAELHLDYKRRDQNASHVIKQLEVKNDVLSKAYNEIVKEHDKMQNEVERCKAMLEESSRCQIYLKEQVLQMETKSSGKIRKVCEALDRAGSELAEKIHEANQIEFELQMWKYIAEQLKLDMEENHRMRKELEASLLSQSEIEDMIKGENDGLIRQIEEKDGRIESLQKKNVLLEQELKETELKHANVLSLESSMPLEMERHSLLRTINEKDKIFEELHREIGVLEQESLMRGIEGAVHAYMQAETRFKLEKGDFLQLIEEKNHRIEDLMQSMKSLEAKFNDSLAFVSLQLSEKEVELKCFHEAWEKITAAEVLAELEIEEKKMMIIELESDIAILQKKLEFQGASLTLTQDRALAVEATLDAKELEMRDLINRTEERLTHSDALISELKGEKLILSEDLKVQSNEKESMMALLGEMDDKIHKCSREDMQLSAMLGRIVGSIDGSSRSLGMEGSTENVDPTSEDPMLYDSPATKVVLDQRPPFREIN